MVGLFCVLQTSKRCSIAGQTIRLISTMKLPDGHNREAELSAMAEEAVKDVDTTEVTYSVQTHRQGRIEPRTHWDLHHEKWTDSQWYSIAFSDESMFNLGPTVLKKWRWHKRNNKYQTCNLVRTFKSNYLAICVWGAFAALGQAPLVQFNETLKQDKQKKVLLTKLILSATMHYGTVTGVVFRQDNWGPHCAKSVKSYSNTSNISVMKQSAQSPDLNTIENSWACLEMKKGKRNRPSKNADELFDILQEEFSAIADDYFRNLVRFFRKQELIS